MLALTLQSLISGLSRVVSNSLLLDLSGSWPNAMGPEKLLQRLAACLLPACHSSHVAYANNSNSKMM